MCQAKISFITFRAQVLFITAVILVLVIILIAGLFRINNELVQPQLSSSSEALYLQISHNLLQSNLDKYRSIITRVLKINGDQLVTLHQLYNQLHKMVSSYSKITLNDSMNMNYSGTQLIPKLLRSEEGYGDFDTSYSFLCYSNLTKLPATLTHTQKIGLKIQEYFQAFGQMIYQGNLTMQSFDYAYTLADQIFMVYPCLCRRERVFAYVPQTRNWYVDALKQYNRTKKIDEYYYGITKPYLLFTEQVVGLSMYLPMVDEDLSFIGAWSSNIYSHQFSSFLNGGHTISMVLLVDEIGTLIVHNFRVTFQDLPLYFNKTSITGFSESDWQNIISANGKSTCEGFIAYKGLNCAYNQVFKQNMLLGITFIEKYKLYLIMFHDKLQFDQYQQLLGDKINDFFIVKFQDFVYQCSSICCAVFFYIVIANYILMKPIHLIIESIKNRVKYGKYFLQKSSWFSTQLQSDSIYEFYHSYLKLIQQLRGQNVKGKNQHCRLFEQLKYPHQELPFNMHKVRGESKHFRDCPCSSMQRKRIQTLVQEALQNNCEKQGRFD